VDTSEPNPDAALVALALVVGIALGVMLTRRPFTVRHELELVAADRELITDALVVGGNLSGAGDRLAMVAEELAHRPVVRSLFRWGARG
jgi:hypothetical protein